MNFATIKKVQELFDFEISESTASRYIKIVSDAYNLPKPKKVDLKLIREYFFNPD